MHSSRVVNAGGISLGKVCLNSGSSFVLALSNYGAPMLVDSLVIAIKMVQYQTFVTSMETVLVGLMFKGKNVILVFQNILDFILKMVAPSVIAQQVIRWITVVMIMATVTCNCNPNGGAGKVCDVTTGLCQCLPRVEGSKCSQCKPGYFGLGKWNSEGCIQCFCWGHGTVCTSASGWYSSSVISSWPLFNTVSLTDAWTAQDANGSTVNVITPIIGTQYAMKIDTSQLSSHDIFFVAPNKFLGNIRASYGRHLTITLSPSGSQSSAVVQVEMTGQYSNYTLIYQNNELYNSNASVGFTVQIPLLENVWQVVSSPVVNISANVSSQSSHIPTLGSASYYQMMETLWAVSSLKIRAYKSNASGLALDLLSVTLEGSTSDSQSGSPVNNIEMCTCQAGYTGSSCQECAPGFTRASSTNNHPATQCVPCSCNGHAVTACDQLSNTSCSANGTVTPCNPTTGVCTCQHHTAGDHCETCLQGYYGDPLRGNTGEWSCKNMEDDCKLCECPGLIIAQEVNVFANSCSLIGGIPICNNCTVGHTGNKCQNCSDGYFGTPENVTVGKHISLRLKCNVGGKCQPCQCNGRADTCDRRTGKCVDCKNNTSGQNCEVCAPGYFGDAMKNACQACTCMSLPGSTGNCNSSTGVCECLPGVFGSSCDQCIDMYFNLTEKIGCQPCDCSLNGSSSSICDKRTGQCVCRVMVSGRTCSQCQNGYWNVNQISGCDACSCNASGTQKYLNGSVQETCDVQTGQCSCALPGIVGRTCNTCSPASKSSFQYVKTFYLGSFPDCVLCGECLDSWGSKINIVGQHLAEMDAVVTVIWNDYNNQTSEQVNSSLAVIEDNINKTTELLTRFKDFAQELNNLKSKFIKSRVDQVAIMTEMNSFNYTSTNLQTNLNSLLLRTDAVNVTSTTTTSGATLRQQLDNLAALAETAQSQGNASYMQIQALAFVVASPEDRLQKLKDQAKQSMDLAAAINQTYSMLKILYDNSLIPGSSERVNKLHDLDSQLSNISQLIINFTAILQSVSSDVDAASGILLTLVAESTKARSLHPYTGGGQMMPPTRFVANASSVQRLAEKVLRDAKNFKLVAEKAEQTMITSFTALLECIIALSQAQADLTTAQLRSLSVTQVQLPSLNDMLSLVQQIEKSSVKASDVADANVKSQQALVDSGQVVKLTQEALTEARRLSESIQLMKTDILDAQRLRQEAENVQAATSILNARITAVLQQANAHNSQLEANITQIMQLAQQTTDELKNLSACFTQRGLDITSAVTSSNEIKQRADSVTQEQVKLTQLMYTINVNENDPALSPALTNLTEANSIVTKLSSDLAQLEALAQLETLIPELQAKDQEIKDLESEIDKLTTELDGILLAFGAISDSTLCTA
ncbi:hypothetical protein Btru_050370 [Bulinus truncatus]|nr:hypothetical protein Btru_050370 [Bulinus truncatus]